MAKRLLKSEYQQEWSVGFDHASVTADTTIKLLKVPAGRKWRLDGVDLINPTGLAADVANFFNLKILKDATIMANWSTETGQQGTLAADTFVLMTLSATDVNRVASGGEVISFFMDETGTATLPAGRIVLRWRSV